LREKPEVRPGDWITIGARDAVVCTVYPEGNVEIVYLDRNIAITEDVYWNEGEWKLVWPVVPGENADNLPRLSGYVAILRSGFDEAFRGDTPAPQKLPASLV